MPRLLRALARVGLDFRPFLRRLREAVVHPVRVEVAELRTEAAGLRSELTELRAAGAGLRTEVTELRNLGGAIRHESKELRTEAAELGEKFEREIAAARDDFASMRQAVDARFSAALRSADGSLRTEVVDRMAAAEQALSNLDKRLSAEHDERRLRMSTIEQVIVANPLIPAADKRANATPLVSIILPTRDRANLIGDAIASVKAQSFPDWELIIVDDGSTDDTAPRVAPELADSRIRYMQRPAGGAGAARNSGLSVARGAYIAYIDSDNIWYPHFLAAAVPVLDADFACDLVYGVLVTNDHGLQDTCLLWLPFDRERLLRGNFIDMNVIVHRKSLVDRCGGFDETLGRLVDWDLVLRYTEHAPARALPVLAARYRVCDDRRITDTLPQEPYKFTIARKWYPPERLKPGPRVLCLIAGDVESAKADIESEMRCMSRWGTEIEVWHAGAAPSHWPVPVHNGALADAIARMRPDAIHVHATSAAVPSVDGIATPVTVRLHDRAVPQTIDAWLARPFVRAVYVPAVHGMNCGDARLRALPATFDSAVFMPHAEKDRKLVVVVEQRSGDTSVFADLARRLPDHRCVLVVAGNAFAADAQAISATDRARFVPLLRDAAVCVCFGSGEGGVMPAAVPEAMATGAHVLVPAGAEWRQFLGAAVTACRDVAHVAEIITATAQWTDQQWRRASDDAIVRAFSVHADELALRPIFEDWCALRSGAESQPDSSHDGTSEKASGSSPPVRVMPSRIRLEASSFCQLRCPSCPTTSGAIHPAVGSGFLKLKDFEQLVERNPSLERIEISNYGEIFLDPHIAEILECAHRKGIGVTIENGANLNHVREAALEALVKYKVRMLLCSIDGASPETYRVYRVRGDFDTVIRNIEIINAFKRQYQSELPHLIWQFVIFGHNEHEIPRAREMAEKLGMEFRLKFTWDEEFSPIRDAAFVRAQLGADVVTRKEYEAKHGQKYAGGICLQLWDDPQINFDGRNLGCCRNFWGDFGGNAFTDGLAETVNSERMIYARDMLTGKRPPREDIPCTTCDMYTAMRERAQFIER
jgi:MoaA/NifB/PqqE/SkfB family radical SAM enzyme